MPKPPKFASLSLDEAHYSYDHLDAMERLCYAETFQAEAEFMVMRLGMFKTTLVSTFNSCAATMQMEETLRCDLERHLDVSLDEFIARYRNLNIMNGFEELGKPKPKTKAECEKRMKSWQTQNRPKGYGYTLYRYLFQCIYKLFDPSKLALPLPDLFRQFFRYRALLQLLKMNIDYGIKGSSQPLFIAGSSFGSSMSPLAKQCEIFVTEKKRIPIVCATRESFLEYVREKATYYGRLVRKQEGIESDVEEETDTEEVCSISKESFRSRSSKQSQRVVKTGLHHADDPSDVASQGSLHSQNRNPSGRHVKTETTPYQMSLPPELPSIPPPNDAWSLSNVMAARRPAYGPVHSPHADTAPLTNWPYPAPHSQQSSNNNFHQSYPMAALESSVMGPLSMNHQQSEGQLSFGIRDENRLTGADLGLGDFGTSMMDDEPMEVEEKIGTVTDDEKSSSEWRHVPKVHRNKMSPAEMQQLQQMQMQEMQMQQMQQMHDMDRQPEMLQQQSSDVAVQHLVHVANIFEDLLRSFPSPQKLRNIDPRSFEKLRRSFESMRDFYTIWIEKHNA